MTDHPHISPGPISAQIAAGLRRVREEQHVTYTELVKRLAELGRPIPILGVRRIERGERRVDIDDLAALARALKVPPIALLFPLDTNEKVVELLPGQHVSPTDGMLWFIGQGPMPTGKDEEPEPGWEAEAAPVLLRHRHRQVVEWYESAARIARRVARDEASYNDMVFKLRATAVDELSTLRAEMRRHGLLLPGLPHDLAHIDASGPDTWVHRAPQPGVEDLGQTD